MRQKDGLHPLDIETVALGACHREHKFTSFLPDISMLAKQSSTLERLALLGYLLRPIPSIISATNIPVVIGVTGPIAAGKTTIRSRAKYLYPSRVQTLDCDQLIQMSLEPGKPCYEDIVSFFGQNLICQTEPPYRINKEKLARVVLASNKDLKKLKDTIYIYVHHMIKFVIAQLSQEKFSVIRKMLILESTMLYESNISALCNEVWCVLSSKYTAENRISERKTQGHQVNSYRLYTQGLSVALATKCGSTTSDYWQPCQINSDTGPVGKAHRVFFSDYGIDFMDYQINIAIGELLNRVDIGSEENEAPAEV